MGAGVGGEGGGMVAEAGILPGQAVNRRSWRAWLVLLLAFTGLALVVWPWGAYQEPVLTLTNVSTEPVAVHVGGDRVRIVRPQDTEYLELPVAAWAWPRRIEL